MPLIKGKSKKAFEHNVEAEMHAGKPQDQSLAIAYSVKRKAKKKASGGAVESGSKDMNFADGGEAPYSKSEAAKLPTKSPLPSIDVKIEQARRKRQKMAEGGQINESAKSERRPMPDERDKDSRMASRNSGKKALVDADWTGQPTVRQAQSNNGREVLPIKRPRMVPSNAFSTRLYDEEADLQNSAGVNNGPQRQPPEHDNEEGADRQGPNVSDMESQHNNHRKPYAKGGPVMEPKDHEIQAKLRSDEAHLQSMKDPSEDEGASDARSRNEMSPNRQGPAVPDMEDEHSTGRRPYAEGGSVQYRDAMDNEDMEMELNPAHGRYSADNSHMQPKEEHDEELHDSIAAAIMAKKDRESRMDSDSDIDEQMMLANGGEIHSHDSIYSDDNDQVDLSRNADEDANEEDQLSFNALRKENYSESAGLRQLNQPNDSNLHGDDEESDSENKHDMVNVIRRKMSMRRQFKGE